MTGDPDAADAPAVVLVRPREEGNVGAAARAMANMGLGRLILVEPAAPLGGQALAMAVGARSVLLGCERSASLALALAPFRRVVATSSTRDRRLRAALLAPRDLPEALAADPPGTPTALVFGPEVGGLTNEELALASLLVTVPCAPRQPTLNLAQAVLILAYELYLARVTRGARASRPVLPAAAAASTAELDGLFEQLRELLGRIGFERDSTFPGVLRDLRQLAARAAPVSREVSILRGICRRAQRALQKSDGKKL
ncbi:MAG TPA: RNA methyltransferase [Thermoanaerobaculia bacterium]|nr:RNA methyltransferase [Thermoanaerobaculia bacterium]